MDRRSIFPIQAITRDPAYEQALGLNRPETMRKITDLWSQSSPIYRQSPRPGAKSASAPSPKMKIFKHLGLIGAGRPARTQKNQKSL
jgi:hypothetical protein